MRRVRARLDAIEPSGFDRAAKPRVDVLAKYLGIDCGDVGRSRLRNRMMKQTGCGLVARQLRNVVIVILCFLAICCASEKATTNAENPVPLVPIACGRLQDRAVIDLAKDLLWESGIDSGVDSSTIYVLLVREPAYGSARQVLKTHRRCLARLWDAPLTPKDERIFPPFVGI
jgi:hypothetical protein